MTIPNEEWVAELAQVLKDRDRAVSMIKQWQRKLDEANATLAVMTSQAAPEQVQEQAPEPAQV